MNHYLFVNETADNVPVQIDVGDGSLVNTGPVGATSTVGKKVNICLAPLVSKELAALSNISPEIGLKGKFVFRIGVWLPFIVNASDVEAFLVAKNSHIRATLVDTVIDNDNPDPANVTYYYIFQNMAEEFTETIDIYTGNTAGEIFADADQKADIAFLDDLKSTLEFTVKAFEPPLPNGPLEGVVEIGEGPFNVDGQIITGSDNLVAKLRSIGYTVTVFEEEESHVISCAGAKTSIMVRNGIWAPADTTTTAKLHLTWTEPSGEQSQTFEWELLQLSDAESMNIGTWLNSYMMTETLSNGNLLGDYFLSFGNNGTTQMEAQDVFMQAPVFVRLELNITGHPFFSTGGTWLEEDNNPTFEVSNDDYRITMCLKKDAPSNYLGMIETVYDVDDHDDYWWKNIAPENFDVTVKIRPAGAPQFIDTYTGNILNVMDEVATAHGLLIQCRGQHIVYGLAIGRPGIDVSMTFNSEQTLIGVARDMPPDFFNSTMFVKDKEATFTLGYEGTLPPPIVMNMRSIFNKYGAPGSGTPAQNLVDLKMVGPSTWTANPNTTSYATQCSSAQDPLGCEHYETRNHWSELNEDKLNSLELAVSWNNDIILISNVDQALPKPLCMRFQATTDAMDGDLADTFGFAPPEYHMPT